MGESIRVMVAVRPRSEDGTGSRLGAAAPAAGAALAVALLAPLLALAGVPAFWHGIFVDADCYMRLQRVLELMQGGGWFDAVSERTDAPLGEVMHWTRPFDLLIWAGAWPLAQVVGPHKALELWGGLVSPLLLLPTLLVLHWGMAPVLGRRAIWGAIPFFVAQPQLALVYIAGRPDHHSLLALCAAAVFAVSWRLSGGQAGRRHAAWGGAAAGLGLWVSVEGLVAAALGAGWLGLLWLVQGGPWRLRALSAWLQGFALLLAVAMVIEYPPAEWSEPRYVKLSLVHLLAAATAAAAWTLIGRLAATAVPLSRRLAWSVAGLSAPLLLLAGWYPEIFGGPLVLHPAEAQAWSPTVGEMSSLLPTDRDMALILVLQLGPAAVAAGWLLLRLRQAPALHASLLAPLLLFGLAGLLQNRWSSYAQIAAVYPLLLAGRDIWRWPGAVRLGGAVLPLRAPVLGLFYSLPLMVILLLGALLPAPPQRPPAPPCRWPEAADLLRQRYPAAPGDDILFSHLFAGPELMWRSGWRVVAAPYISNTGIADSIRVFATTDDAAAHAILQRRKASLLLVCAQDGEAREYRGERNDYHPIVGLPHAPPDQSLHARLSRGEPPAWAEPLPLPPELEGMRLYRLRR